MAQQQAALVISSNKLVGERAAVINRLVADLGGPLKDDDGDHAGAGTKCRLTTKYYEAIVSVKECDLDQCDDIINQGGVQAVILLTPVSEVTTQVEIFDSPSLAEVESKVTVLSGNNNDVNLGAVRERLLDLGVELVHASDVARVREVLEVTMWQNMNMLLKDVCKPRPCCKVASGDVVEIADERLVHAKREAGTIQAANGETDQDERQVAALEAITSVEDTFGGGIDSALEHHPPPEQEYDDFDLEAMMAKVKNIRAGNLSGDDRREAAAQVALQFAAMLGIKEDEL